MRHVIKFRIKQKVLWSVIIFIFSVFIIQVYFEISVYFFELKIPSTKTSMKTEHKTLKMNGYDIHFHLSGPQNAPAIVFLHPAFSDHRAFNLQVDFFSKKYRVITLDLIGHGLSKTNKSKDKIDVSLEHILNIIQLEKIAKIHLVGVSLGALIAQHFALEYPNKVLSLTAVGGYDINKENKEVAKAQRSSNLGLIIRALFSMKAFRKKTAEITCQSEQGQALFYESSSHQERKSFLAMQRLENIIKDRPSTTINYPLLIMVGEFDVPLAIKMAKEWHKSINHSAFFYLKMLVIVLTWMYLRFLMKR